MRVSYLRIGAIKSDLGLGKVKLTTTLNIFAMGILLLCGAGIALTLWNARESERHLQRTTLANESYIHHLKLSKGVYRLLNRMADEELGHSLSGREDKKAIVAQLQADLTVIRRIIGNEIDLVGEEEIEELELLAEVELKVMSLIDIADAPTDAGLASRWLEATRSLNEGAMTFREMIDVALEEEKEEVEETRDAAEKQFALARRAAIVLAIIALGFTIITLVAVRRQVSRPLSNLLAAIRRFGAGDYTARASAEGAGEIAMFGDVVNEMAEKVEASARKEAVRRNELEAAVHSRTRQLEGALAEMEKASENRKRLLADVSHELRTPLTIIRGEADVALRGGDKPAEDYREALSRARDAAAHTSRLVDDLLFVARSEAGAAKLDVAEIDLVALARGAAQLVDRPVEMALSSPTALVEADAQRLRQCVLILLENAARYGGAGVTIRVDKSVGGYRVAVEDNGPGMTEEERSRAFQRYFRGSDAASHYSEGVGLGLPVAKSIVDAHGGAITIDERAGGGLIVAFTVPARAKGIAA